MSARRTPKAVAPLLAPESRERATRERPVDQAAPERPVGAADPAGLLTIAAVERDTGLSKDLLRVWERRYGFPAPTRDAQGDRCYPAEQVAKLHLVRRLMARGMRPGKLLGMPHTDLAGLASEGLDASPATGATGALDDEFRTFMGLIRGHDVDSLRARLSQMLLRVGLAGFVTGYVARLNSLVGEEWMQGRLQVFEEHLYSEVLQGLLRQAIQSVPREEARPAVRIVLSTIPGEPHALGLLMAEAMMALEGCRCLSLGTQTPLEDMCRAVEAHRADVLALSFSAYLPAQVVNQSLTDLRERLPEGVEVWAGGQSPALSRRVPAGVRAVSRLESLSGEVARLRIQAR